ncbi:substrate-specific activator of APC-dependent proteolysis [Coemansia sp. RSA 2711]|nr:substrate-specific activator of APC-dependent proteolysis [Coemansia sp. RSA 2711]
MPPEAPRPSGARRTTRAAPAGTRSKPSSRKPAQRPPVPPPRKAACARVPEGKRATLPPRRSRSADSAAPGKQRASRHLLGSDDDGSESPTLDAVGVVTRSMARRMQAQDPGRTKPALVSQSSAESTATAATLEPGASGEESSQAQAAGHTYDTPENHARHVRRSPQFNYDRFIPARSPDAAPDLRRFEAGHRAASPGYPRGGHVEREAQREAQVEEANRTYAALLRAELLNDRAVDVNAGRLRPSSPPATRRDMYRPSPRQLPSLVPWSGSGAPSSSSRPNTPPCSPPVFMYRSPRKASLTSPASMPALAPRNLFGRASPVHEAYQQTALAAESRRLLSPRRAPRRIARDPVKVLDAPGIRDDYYLNLMDWSAANQVAVALDRAVYVWDAQSSRTRRLCDVGAADWVTSVAWAEHGAHLAVGLNSGAVQIWDAARARRLRTFAGHTRRVGVAHWNRAVVSTGSRDKRIFNYDTRAREGALVSTYYAHSQEVCGLRWSPDRTQLASGGNDNMLMVWDTRFAPLDSRQPSFHPDIAAAPRAFRRPLFRLAEHTAAVKALAWSPTQRGLLASGGGTDDRCIRLWDSLAGRQLSAHDTRSQVCNLSWAHDGSELVSTHGYSENHVVVWRYPAMQPVSVLTGHTKRVLYLAHSPDGQTVATAAGDETIRFWDIFPKDISPELGALPAGVSQIMRTPARAAAEPSAILDDLAHIR